MSTLLLNSKLSLTVFILFLHSYGTTSLCRNYCNNIRINYPFSIDEGCGAPQFRHMLNCSASDLFFLTPSGTYKIQTIDYNKRSVVIFDPSMSTCSILQPHHDFVMTDIQSVTVPPSPDTIFVLINCSIDSPVLNHYRCVLLPHNFTIVLKPTTKFVTDTCASTSLVTRATSCTTAARPSSCFTCSTMQLRRAASRDTIH